MMEGLLELKGMRFHAFHGCLPQERVDGGEYLVDFSVRLDVEAASRSLKEHTEENIVGLVNRIIDSQIADGLLRNAPLTFKDIEDVKAVFIEKLKTMYHTRISYPDLKK